VEKAPSAHGIDQGERQKPIPLALAPAADVSADDPGGQTSAAMQEPDEDDAALEHRIRTLANLGQASAAEMAASAGVTANALSAKRHLLHAITLAELRRYADAAQAARRALYLDPTLAVAHVVLGAILCGLRDFESALRAYRNGYGVAAARPRDEIAPCSGGEPAGLLAAAAKAQMSLLATMMAVGS
jgi:chemotaxis protein methyltransferase CheR